MKFNLYSPAERLKDVKMSPMREMMERCRKMKEQGEDVISFAAGEPDFPTPEPIKENVIQCLNENMTHYTSNRGALSLRKAIAKRLREEIGVSYSPETEILVTTGGAEAIHHAIHAVVNPGDEVLILTPAFVNYENLVEMCGGVPVLVPLQPAQQFQIDIEEIEKRITSKTVMLILNNPCNPTGAVYSEESLLELCAVAQRHNLIVFSDEIYSRILYGNTKFISVASIPGMKERTILMNGFSKTYSMTGWRLGYLAVDSRFMPQLIKVHQYTTTTGNTFVQEGVARAMNLPETQRMVGQMVDAFGKRRRLILQLLEHIPQISVVCPQGAFYLMVDVSGLGMDGRKFAEALLEKKLVSVVPMEPLGSQCRNYVRMSFAASEEDIIKGIARMKEFIETMAG